MPEAALLDANVLHPMDAELVAEIVVLQAKGTRRPSLSPRDILNRLAPMTPEFARLAANSRELAHALAKG